MNYEPVIGLEVHIELSTKSKMFCACSANYFGAEPNSHTCPICLGLPGTLPSPNRLAIEYAQKLGQALNCQGRLSSKFDRKNYFYPDLPKGFQISQYDLPFSQKGIVTISIVGQTKKVGITRAHLEEDTGKLTHVALNGRRVTLIDFNRSGVPLIEIVSEPEMNSAQEAKSYAQKLQQIVRYLKISDADMEKGSMRIEPNVSLRKSGDNRLPPYKVELKNINSYKFVEKAINFEIDRQLRILDSGKIPQQETRGWNELKSETYSQRAKEESHDYRYFPEPDLPPLSFTSSHLTILKKSLPELPDKKIQRFKNEYKLTTYDVEILTRDLEVANYFEAATRVGAKYGITPKQVANALIHKKFDRASTLPVIFIRHLVSQSRPSKVSQKELETTVSKVFKDNQKAVEDYKKGKENAIIYLVGQVMKKFAQKVDPNLVKKKLLEKMPS